MEISREDSIYIRGLCAISILISHLITYSGIANGSKLISVITGMMGYLPVTIFFFLSGYGLMMSYQEKGERYVESFLRNRILPYYIKYLIIALLYTAIRELIGYEIEWNLIIRTLIYGGTVIKFGWYLQTQLLLYIIFYISCRISSTHQMRLVTLLIVLLWVLSATLGLDTTFYVTTPGFLLGLAWPVLMHKPIIVRISGYSIAGFVVIWLLAMPFDEPINAYLRCGLASLCFCVTITLCVRIVVSEANHFLW